MNPIQLAQQIYSPGPGAMRSARSVELQIFAEVTARLRATTSEGTTSSFARLAEALRDNRRLWMRLAADVAGDGNKLPPALRAQIIQLAAFTDAHSRRILHEGDDPTILIEINAAVMRGLGGRQPQGIAS